MKIVIAYPFYFPMELDEHLIYLPELAEKGEDALEAALVAHKPDVLVVGNNKVTADMLDAWRAEKGIDAKLAVLRRGTSLARIDTEYAGQHHIDVLNTPGVNAHFIANYMLMQLGIFQGGNIIAGGGRKRPILLKNSLATNGLRGFCGQ